MPETAREKDSNAPLLPFSAAPGRAKNKYIKMPAGKMKIQTNALIRDAEALLENVSRCWLLLLLGASSYTQLPVQDEAVEGDGERGGAGRGERIRGKRSVRASMLSSPLAIYFRIFSLYFVAPALCGFCFKMVNNL